MRKFKFRAYNTRTKEFAIIDDLYWFEENFVHNNGDGDWIVQQFTGVLTGSGEEVYEGDVLFLPKSWISCDFDRMAVVEWSDRHSCFLYKWKDQDSKIEEDHLFIRYLQAKIIGNVLLYNPLN